MTRFSSFLLSLSLPFFAAGNVAFAIEIISVDVEGHPGIGLSDEPSISGNGRWVVFQSSVPNLIENDTNGFADIFLRDRTSRTTERISRGIMSTEANGNSTKPEISETGEYIVFASTASNLVDDDNNSAADVFLYTVATQSTVRISLTDDEMEVPEGCSSPSVSSDGKRIAFLSKSPTLGSSSSGLIDSAFVRDLDAGTTTLVSLGTTGSRIPETIHGLTISNDGKFVAFYTNTSTLMNNTDGKVFLRDLDAEQTIILSPGPLTERSLVPSISGDGRFVHYVSYDSNGATTYLYDRIANETQPTMLNPKTGATYYGSNGLCDISSNGRHLMFTASDLAVLLPEKVDTTANVFVRDLDREITDIVSAYPTALEPLAGSSADMSDSGDFVVFKAPGTRLSPSSLYQQIVVAGTEIPRKLKLGTGLRKGSAKHSRTKIKFTVNRTATFFVRCDNPSARYEYPRLLSSRPNKSLYKINARISGAGERKNVTAGLNRGSIDLDFIRPKGAAIIKIKVKRRTTRRARHTLTFQAFPKPRFPVRNVKATLLFSSIVTNSSIQGTTSP